MSPWLLQMRWAFFSAFCCSFFGWVFAKRTSAPSRQRASTTGAWFASLTPASIRVTAVAAASKNPATSTGTRRAVADDAKQPEIDERWLKEWEDYGLRQLDDYMKKHAAFDAYYARHRIPEEHDGDPSPSPEVP